jgi:hypothetical protein
MDVFCQPGVQGAGEKGMNFISIGETLVLFCCFEQDRQKTGAVE